MKLFRHPLHPVVAHFPVAFLLAAPCLLAWARWQDAPEFWRGGLWLLKAGLAAGLAAACFGVLDAFLRLRGRRDVYGVACLHAALMLTALLVDFGALLAAARGGNPQASAAAACLALSGAAALLLVAGGWFGGEMVYGRAIGSTVAPPAGSGGKSP